MKLRDIWGLLTAAVFSWVNDNVPRLGAALSFYTVFAISPLFVIVAFIARLWVNKEAVHRALMEQATNLLGTTGARGIEAMINTAAPLGQGVLASSIAVVTFFLTATGVFIELQSDLNTIWGVEQKPGRAVWGYIRGRLLSFALVIGIGFLLLVTLIISAALAGIGKFFAFYLSGLGMFWMLINALFSFAVITVLFAMIFKVLPDVKIAWRDVWLGAVCTAFLFTLGKFLLGLYLGRSAALSAYGAAGSVVLILLWVYYSAQILYFGAELIQAYANRFGCRLEPKPNARWILPQQQLPPPPPKPVKPATSNRKAHLVFELRQEVEHLRVIVETRKKQLRIKKEEGNW